MRHTSKPGNAPAEVRSFRSISVKLTAVAVLIGMLPLMLVSGLMLGRMEIMTERELTQSYRWLISEHIGNVEDKLRLYEDCLEYAAQNTTIQEALTNGSGNAYTAGNAISTEVFKTVPMENRKEVYDCLVYATGPADAYGTRVKSFTELDRQRWERAGWKGGDDVLIDIQWEKRNVLSLIREIRYVDVDVFSVQQVGLIRLDLFLDGLLAPDNGEDKPYHVVLFDESGRRLYASDSGIDDNYEKWSAQNRDGDGYDVDNYSVLKGEIERYGLKLLYLFDNNELAQEKAKIKRSIFSLALALLLLVIVGSRIYFTGFTKRVNQLLEKFRIAGAGDLSPTQPIGGDDEIAVLDRRFGQMLIDMDEMNRRSEAQRNTIREAKYRNLQLQINPHFLYNTLETISAIGAMHGVMQVCELCEKLGDIFRYSLGKNEGKYTPVARELRQTRNYIFIQQVRHKFDVFYSVDVDAEEVYMLRFLLQPIIENAVLHGLARNEGPGTLEVYVGERDGDLEIRISDDGVGMSEDDLASLRARLLESTDQRENVSNIGVWNISQRIRLSYGEPYGITVQSKLGQGSTFTLRLPMITKGMVENDEIPAPDR